MGCDLSHFYVVNTMRDCLNEFIQKRLFIRPCITIFTQCKGETWLAKTTNASQKLSAGSSLTVYYVDK